MAVWLALPIVLRGFKRRADKEPDYALRWSERFGHVPFSLEGRPLWLHAASLGEVVAIIPLAERLLSDYPNSRLLITTMTPTGSARVSDHFGDRVDHCFVPLDVGRFVERFLEIVQPKALLLAETELWPNLLRCCHARKIPVAVVSARLTEASMHGYARFPGKAVMQKLLSGIEVITAQTENDALRYLELGASADSVRVSGSIKFDLQIDRSSEVQAEVLRGELGGRLAWVAASTHEGEEAAALAAHQHLLATSSYSESMPPLLVIAARHPDRFNAVYQLAVESGLRVGKFTAAPVLAELDVLVLDVMGQLMPWFVAADIAFVGGSLVPIGGHNVLEPAAAHCAVLVGPHHHEFSDICDLMSKAGALRVVADTRGLERELVVLATGVEERQTLADAAKQVVADNQGALGRTLAEIVPLLV